MKKLIVFLLLATSAFGECSPFSKDLITSDSKVVLYTWNPYMPLSVLGLNESKDYFNQRGIKFIPLLDEMYDGDLPSKDEYMFEGNCYYIPKNFLKNESLNNHFPGYYYFVNSELIEKLYGYTFPERLDKLIR